MQRLLKCIILYKKDAEEIKLLPCVYNFSLFCITNMFNVTGKKVNSRDLARTKTKE